LGAPFQYKVNQLKAQLAQAQQQVKQLKANYEQATANVEGLAKQLAFHEQRLADYQQMVSQDAQTLFRLQDTQVQYETVQYQLAIGRGRAAQRKACHGFGNRRRQYDRCADPSAACGCKVGPPADHGSRAGRRHCHTDGAYSRRPRPAGTCGDVVHRTDDIMLIGMFSPNGFETIRSGAAVKLVFDDRPGRIYHAKVVEVPQAVGQGQVAVSGMLARAGAVEGAKTYPARISIPDDLDRAQLRLGMPGNATVFADNAGVIGLLMSILVWISSYTAYL
jgi:multidrug resistance efflux pump